MKQNRANQKIRAVLFCASLQTESGDHIENTRIARLQ